MYLFKSDLLEEKLLDDTQVVSDNFSQVEQKISSILNTTDVKVLHRLGGLSNINYKMLIDSKEYAVRIPGEDTEKFVNREWEKFNSELTSRLGINPEYHYFDAREGIKIVEYIPNSHCLSRENRWDNSTITKLAEMFRKLHNCDETIKGKYDFIGNLNGYEKLVENLGTPFYENYDEVRQSVMSIWKQYMLEGYKFVPCHNDPVPENFVVSEGNRVFLIDWEYSAMNDPLWDIAYCINEGCFTPDSEQFFLRKYFGREMDEEECERLLVCKILANFLWSVWSLTKFQDGEEFILDGKNHFERTEKLIREYIKNYKGEAFYE